MATQARSSHSNGSLFLDDRPSYYLIDLRKKTMTLLSLEELQAFITEGGYPRFLLFWGHQQSGNLVSKSCLSQWYESDFDLDGINYKTVEHYMMAEKARLFNDQATYEKILIAQTPHEAKRLGREVHGFNHGVWSEKSFDIVIKGNVAKFSQNILLKNFLLHTEDQVLVEASPVDPVWGIGLAADHEQSHNPFLWRGKNLLGFALMATRDNIRQATAY
jgi:ribA/ribD-fused uncharacterized protein